MYELKISVQKTYTVVIIANWRECFTNWVDLLIVKEVGNIDIIVVKD